MPQLRKDPIVNRWVIIATERARRPAAFIDPPSTATAQQDCPFCQDASRQAIYTQGDVRVVKSGTPILDVNKPFDRKKHGLYDVCYSHGHHELVIETSTHTANMADLSAAQIQDVFDTYALRMSEHRKDPAVHYVLAYKNYGVAAGSRNIGHARSQIMAVPVLPMRVKEKIDGAKKYFDYHERCVFCDLLDQELQSRERIVAQNEGFVALTPFAPRFPFETWIVPKRHHCDFSKGIEGQSVLLAQLMKDILLRFKIGLNDPSYNYMIQTSPIEHGHLMDHRYPSISDDYHWHIELIPRLTRVAGFERGSGFYICPIPPEMSAAFLREVIV